MYILLADDTEPGYHTDNAAWQPLLHPYQQVLFDSIHLYQQVLSSIHPYQQVLSIPTEYHYLITRSLGALRAPTSRWRPFGPLDFVLHALRALRPCDPRKVDQHLLFHLVNA